MRLGNLRIPTDNLTQMSTFFYKDHGERPAFPVDCSTTYLGQDPRQQIPGQDRADRGDGGRCWRRTGDVGLAGDAAGIDAGALGVLDPAGTFLRDPVLGRLCASFGAFVLVALYLIALLPRLSAGIGAAATAVLLATLVGAHYGLMVSAGMWIQLMAAASCWSSGICC